MILFKNLITISFIFSFTGSFGQYYIKRVFTTENGLPSNSVVGIVKEIDGKIYLACGGQIVEYGGSEFISHKAEIEIDFFDWNDGVLSFSEDGNILIKRWFSRGLFDTKRNTFNLWQKSEDSSRAKYNDDGSLMGFILMGRAGTNSKGITLLHNSLSFFKYHNGITLDITNALFKSKSEYQSDFKDFSITVDNKYAFWTILNNKIYKINEDATSMSQYSIDQEMPDEVELFSVYETKNGKVYLSFSPYGNENESRLLAFDKETQKSETISIKDVKAFNEIEGILYAASKNGIYRIEGNKYELLVDGSFDRIKKGENGSYLFYKRKSKNQKLIVFDGDRSFHEIQLGDFSLVELVATSEGDIFVASNEGLIEYSKTNINHVNLDEHGEKKEKNVDVGILQIFSNGGILYEEKSTSDYLMYFHDFYYLDYISKKKIFIGRSSNKEFSAQWNASSIADTTWLQLDEKLFYITKGELYNYKIKDELLKQSEFSWLMGNKNSLFVRLKGRNGTYELKNGDLIKRDSLNLIYIDEYIDLYENENVQKRIEVYSKGVKLVELDSLEWIEAISCNARKNIWFNSWHSQTIPKPTVSCITVENVVIKREISELVSGFTVIISDKYGNAWMRTDSGLAHCYLENDQIKIRVVDMLDGMISTQVWGLKIINDSILWISTNHGVSRINLEDQNKNHRYIVRNYNEKEGLVNSSQDDLYEFNGNIVAASGGAFSIIFDSISTTFYTAPKAFFETAICLQEDELIFEYSFSTEAKLEMNYSSGDAIFTYNAIKFNNARDLLFTTKLYRNGDLVSGGMENSHWLKSRSVKFSALDPGDYKMELFCRVGFDGNISEPTVIEFSILPAWWQTLYFKILTIIIVCSMLYLVYKWRIQQLKARQIELEGIVDNRTKELRNKNEEILDSINYARRIQEAILPPTKLVKEYLSESFILYKPKDIVAGDFYWFDVHGDEIFFAAADCTGHGVPGAMVSVVCANALNRAVNEMNITEPAKILDKVRELVVQTFEKSEDEVKDGMDISFCKLNLKTRKLVYAGAHNPLYRITSLVETKEKVLSNETHMLIEYKGDKQPIGKWAFEKPFLQQEIQLLKGDSIYLSTDGYADQFGGEHGKKFMYKPFKQLFLSLQNESMEKQKELLAHNLEKWKGSHEQVDDVCVIGVRV